MKYFQINKMQNKRDLLQREARQKQIVEVTMRKIQSNK